MTSNSALSDLNRAIRRAKIRAAIAAVRQPEQQRKRVEVVSQPRGRDDMAEITRQHNESMARLRSRGLLRFADADGREVACGWCRSANADSESLFCGGCRWMS